MNDTLVLEAMRQMLEPAQVVIEGQRVETRKVVSVIFDNAPISYRAGWWAFVEGMPYSRCLTDAARDGWIASWEADEAMRKVGVRK